MSELSKLESIQERTLKYEILKEAYNLDIIGFAEYRKAIATMLYHNGSIGKERLDQMISDIESRCWVIQKRS